MTAPKHNSDFRGVDSTAMPCPRCGRKIAWHFTFGVPNPMRHYAANSKRWCKCKEKV